MNKDEEVLLGRLDERTQAIQKQLAEVAETIKNGCPYGRETRARLKWIALAIGAAGSGGVVAVKEVLGAIFK